VNEHEQPHLPPPSLWPLAFAAGIALILTGLVVSTIVAVVGAVLAVVFGFLWIRDVARPERAPLEEAEPEPGLPGAAPQRADEGGAALPVADEGEVAAYPRSTFLSAATLGLGGVIGGLITLPVLGFAVAPSFTGDELEDVNLGPIENFPEGQFVIATYLEDPEAGEVSRRTMFIRYNGLTEDGQPSFTTLFSRCAHLGCPVQPNGLVVNKDTKTVGEQGIELTTVNVTGFGCPCHGGQYDTEGNRTAGPPVRALDRVEFSIKDGQLYLGKPYSVAQVEGAGARARIQKYARQVPGVHVDGPSAWLYPIEVP
jgi:menaquinol-cytochrome c reductase iron-sulfur subunit